MWGSPLKGAKKGTVVSTRLGGLNIGLKEVSLKYKTPIPKIRECAVTFFGSFQDYASSGVPAAFPSPYLPYA